MLGVRLLGRFRLDGVDLDNLRSRKARTLIKRLGLEEGRAVSADALIDAIWPDTPPADPARDLHVLVSRARSVVGAERLPRGDDGYALAADWWDRAELESLTREAVRRHESGDLVGARTAAEAALVLVHGQLVEDEPDADWLTAARRATTAMVAEVRRVAAAAALGTGQVGDAAALARAALEHDPYDEASLRILMRANVAAGRPATALAEYARAAELLADELGVDPGSDTRQLHEQILRDEVAPAPVAEHTRLVGRDAELGRLDDALVRSRHGAQLLLVTGEPGVGKTTLLDHWTERARSRGVVVLAGRAAQELALQPVLDALAAHLALTAELSPPVGPEASALPGQAAHPDALSLEMFVRLDEAFTSLGGARGLALVIDDADRADPVTWAWLAHVRRRPLDHRFLVVAALRDVAAAPVDDAELLPVPPLDLAAVEQLVGSDRAGDLMARCGGNPLLITELVRAGETDQLPATVRDAVGARLRQAGPAARTLQTAAVLGPLIDLDLVAGVMGEPALAVLDHVDVGVRQSFLAEWNGLIGFRHELVRAGVAEGAGAARRAWIHRQAAQLLRERPDVDPLELARHARAGGDRILAAEGLAHAADIARGRLDLSGALQLLDEAVALHDAAGLRLRRSRVRMACGDLDGADADAQAAMAADQTGEALELRAWSARNRHDLDSAIRLGTAAAAAADDPIIRSSSLVAVAFAHRGMGDLTAADAVLTEADTPVAPAELGLSAWTGVLRVHQGRPLEALAQLEPMLGADARRGLQGYWVEHTLQMTAHAYGLVGRTSDALRVLDHLDAELERRGTGVRYAGLGHTYRSWILRNLGAPNAEDLARAGLELAGSQEIRAQCHLDVADCLFRAGRLDEAAEWLADAERESGAHWFHNKWRFDQRLGVLSALLCLADHDAGGALERARPLIDAAEARGDRRYEVLTRLVGAVASARLGTAYDVDAVDRDLDRLAEVAALEGWWLAAELAEASLSSHARAVAEDLAARLTQQAGDQADSMRRVVAARLG
jgi:DNA-binding SARP family transcriptional activator